MPEADIEELKRRRLQQLMQQQVQQQLQEQVQQEEIERQINTVMNRILESDAKSRLANIRSAMPDYARQIEILLIQLHQAGRIKGKINDQQFKDILTKIKNQKRETKISVR